MSTANGKKIRLGICMAGAVSAGAYTAGVMDYLIKTLERWDQRKNKPPANFGSWQAAVNRSPPAQVLANDDVFC